MCSWHALADSQVDMACTIQVPSQSHSCTFQLDTPAMITPKNQIDKVDPAQKITS